MRSMILKGFIFFCLTAAIAWAQENPAPTFTPLVKFNGFVQFWNQDTNNTWDEFLKHVRVKTTADLDEQTTAVVMPDMSTSGFTLLDAYVNRKLGDQWSVMAGQYKPAFGDDKYLTPTQLKRVDYTKMDSFAFPGFPAKAWDMGVELKKVADEVTLQAGCVQGAGPNVLKDNDQYKDLNARVEWKSSEWVLGGSYYGGTNNSAGFISYQNWVGAHGRYTSGGLDLRAEAIWAPINKSSYLLQAAYKTGEVEPLVWGELGTAGSVQAYQVLGGGINWWTSPKTRLSLNGTLNGVTNFSGPTTGILQIEQVF